MPVLRLRDAIFIWIWLNQLLKTRNRKCPPAETELCSKANSMIRFVGKEMLLRVVVESSKGAFKVISVYKTSKIDRYWMKGGEE